MFLDTSFCIDLLQERHQKQDGPATRKLREVGARPLAMSVFALCELQFGARMAREPGRELGRVAELTEFVEVVYPGPGFAAAYGEVEAHLRKQGTPLPTMDTLIGVMAKMHALPLLAHDPARFSLIPGLVVETYR